MAAHLRVPYQILTSLLYAKFDYLEREALLVVAPTSLLCKQLSISPRQLRAGLQHLEDADLIAGFGWYKHHANIRLYPPVGMAAVVGDYVEVDTDTAYSQSQTV